MDERGAGDFSVQSPAASQASGNSSLKGTLKGWREILVVCAKLLKWEKPYYAAIVFGIVSLVFLLIYWLDPSVVTGFSMLIMIACLADYLVPLGMVMVFPETSWNDKKEQQFSDACCGLMEARKWISVIFCGMGKLKEKNPWLYMAAATVSLSTLAWLGNQMHNLLLAYFFALLFAALPGLKHHGLLDKMVARINQVMKKEKAA